MHGHQEVVLQEGIGAQSVGGGLDGRPRQRARAEAAIGHGLDTDLEGIGHRQHQAEEEDSDQAHHCQGPRRQGVGAAPMVTPHQPGEDGQHQAPQHDRSLQGRPGTGDVEGKRGGAGVITGDVRQREVVEDQRHLQDPHGRHRPGQRQARRRGEVADGGVVAAQGGGVSSTTHHQPGGASRGGDECGQPDERQHQGAKPPPSSGTE